MKLYICALILILYLVVLYFIFSFVFLDLQWFLSPGLGTGIARGLYALLGVLSLPVINDAYL